MWTNFCFLRSTLQIALAVGTFGRILLDLFVVFFVATHRRWKEKEFLLFLCVRHTKNHENFGIIYELFFAHI